MDGRCSDPLQARLGLRGTRPKWDYSAYLTNAGMARALRAVIHACKNADCVSQSEFQSEYSDYSDLLRLTRTYSEYSDLLRLRTRR